MEALPRVIVDARFLGECHENAIKICHIQGDFEGMLSADAMQQLHPRRCAAMYFLLEHIMAVSGPFFLHSQMTCTLFHIKTTTSSTYDHRYCNF